MMTRTEALRRLAEEQRVIPENQLFTSDYFTPADGPGVSRLFYAVYGDGYPIDTFYIPEQLAEENRNGSIRSVVARTSTGDVVSHIALYRSSPSNPHLYEYGLGLTLPAYRGTLAFHRTNQLALRLIGTDGIDGIYGEAVCNHITTQKLSLQSQMLETGIEPALMPARAYETEQSARGRVGCMLYFRVDRDQRRVLHVPPPYRNELAVILEGLKLDRELSGPDMTLSGAQSELEVKRFEFAGVARCTLVSAGIDFPVRLAELERELIQDGYALSQFFVDLGTPCSGAVVEALRNAGYFFCGLLPIWFGNDGLLMQKLFTGPGFDELNIYSERGMKIRDLVRKDWERSVSQA